MLNRFVNEGNGNEGNEGLHRPTDYATFGERSEQLVAALDRAPAAACAHPKLVPYTLNGSLSVGRMQRNDSGFSKKGRSIADAATFVPRSRHGASFSPP